MFNVQLCWSEMTCRLLVILHNKTYSLKIWIKHADIEHHLNPSSIEIYVKKNIDCISTLLWISGTRHRCHHCVISYTSLPVCYAILCGNENQAEPLKPTQRWLHHLLHPFWATLLYSPLPHPPASNQNGSEWWPLACRVSPVLSGGERAVV